MERGEKGEFKPSTWLATDQAKLYTVRWSVAFLCGMGKSWTVTRFGSAASFFSDGFYCVRALLTTVTWNISSEKHNSQLLSIKGLKDLNQISSIGDKSTAYESGIPNYRLDSSVNSYSLEFESLGSSYPQTTTIPRRITRKTSRLDSLTRWCSQSM